MHVVAKYFEMNISSHSQMWTLRVHMLHGNRHVHGRVFVVILQ